MDTTAHQLHRLFIETLLVPGLLSFALVVALMLLRSRRANISRFWLYGFFVVGFFWITCVPNVWLMLFPEPCVIQYFSQMHKCDFGPSTHLKMSVFAGLVGAFLALLSRKILQVATRKRAHQIN